MASYNEQPVNDEEAVEVEQAYFFNGSPYCFGCVECELSPCLSDAERNRATIGDGVGACACCGHAFPEVS